MDKEKNYSIVSNKCIGIWVIVLAFSEMQGILDDW